MKPLFSLYLLLFSPLCAGEGLYSSYTYSLEVADFDGVEQLKSCTQIVKTWYTVESFTIETADLETFRCLELFAVEGQFASFTFHYSEFEGCFVVDPSDIPTFEGQFCRTF